MRKVLVFQHVSRENPSHIADYARERDMELDVVKLWESHTIPAVSAYDALILLGGPMGAYEDFPSKETELSAVRRYAHEVPMLGICLGAQLIAHAFNAPVYPHKKEGKHIKEVGHYHVYLTEEGKANPLFKGFPDMIQVLQWHGDTFEPPEEATLLATGHECTYQAFAYKNAYGLQFHVEITPHTLREITEHDRQWAHTDFDLDEEALLREADELAPLMKKQCYQLLDNLLS